MFKQIKRKFHLPDADFIGEARLISGFFKQDKAEFINYDAGYSDPFYDNLILMIKEIESFTYDKTLVAVQTQFADAAEKNMQRCRDKFNDTKHFIRKAFPANPAIREAFGFKRFNGIRKSKLGLNGFMKTFHGFASKYSAELIAVNYSQLMIDEIKTLQEDLENSITDHELFIKSRSTAACERILKMNELYEVLKQICKAGKRIYKNDWARYQRYLFKHFKKPQKMKIAA